MQTITSYKISQRKAAIIAGVSLILMALVAGFSYGWVFSGLVVHNDAAATVAAIKTSLFRFSLGIWGWLLILILDIIVAWALYRFFRLVNNGFSILAAVFRLVYCVFLATATYNLCMVVVLINNPESVIVSTAEFNQAVMLQINAFTHIWQLGLIVFGLHLAVLAYLAIKSGFVPKFLGILLAIAALGYVGISTSKLLIPQYESLIATLETVLSLPMALGEIGLAIWLLIKGGKTKNLA
jgi:hypothetical protein